MRKAKPTARPPHCGQCDPTTRQIETEDGRPARCKDCHPMLAQPAAAPNPHWGVDLAAATVDTWWASGVRQAIVTLAATGQPFSADDVRQMGIAEPESPGQWGAVFRKAHQDGLIQATGAVRESTTASRRAGTVRLWVGTAQPSQEHAA